MILFIQKYWIESLATLLTVLPISTFIFRMAYYQRAVRFLFWFLVVKLTVELVMFYLASKGMPNLYLANTLIIVGYFLVAKMFHEVYDGISYKRIVVGCSVVFSLVVCFDIYRDGMEYSFRYSGMFECIFIMLFGLMYFHELIRHPKIPSLYTYPLFWVCSSLLLYFAPCVFLSPMAFYLDRWPINDMMHVFTIIPYILESMYLIILSFAILAGK